MSERSFIHRRQPSGWSGAGATRWLVVGAIVLAAVIAGRQAGWTGFPADWGVTWADSVNDAVAWVRDNWRAQTKWLNEFLVRDVHVRITSWLERSVAWPVLIVGSALAGVLLFLLATASAADTTLLARYFPLLLGLNAALVGALAALLGYQIAGVVRRYRARAFGWFDGFAARCLGRRGGRCCGRLGQWFLGQRFLG